jgi:membrane protease YdiL (CAAX protease family)
METKRIRLKIFLPAVISVFILETMAGLLSLPDDFKLPAIGILRIIEIIMLLSIARFCEKGTAAIGLEAASLLRGLRRGCLWSAGFAIVAGVSGIVLSLFGVNPLPLLRTNLPENPLSLSLFFLVGGIIGPVAEEIFFRGLVFGFFRRTGFWFALVFSTIFFVSLHSTASFIPISQLVGGIVFAVAYELEKSLLVPITIHVAGNLAIFSISLLSY